MTAGKASRENNINLLFSLVTAIVSLPLTVIMSFGNCPALDPLSGNTVAVDTVAEIWSAVNTASPGDTILVANGTYNLGAAGRYIWVVTDNVTIRSESGDRDAVILDDNYQGSEIITVAASGVTIADLTIKRARTHAIHVVSSASAYTLNTRIYNVRIVDPGQQAIKINPVSDAYFPDYGEVACSTMELTEAGRVEVYDYNSSCYTGGVDGHKAQGWVIRDNTIEGFWCHNGLSEHGVHFWSASRDNIVERNTFINNVRGVGFGLSETGNVRSYDDDPCPEASGYVGHYGRIVRNNFFVAYDENLFDSQYGADTGIALAQSCGTKVYHNSIAFTDAPFNAIEYRFSNTQADIMNNLMTHNIMQRNGGSANLSGNLSYQSLDLFRDYMNGDLHLKSTAIAAIDSGIALPDGVCDDDFDGELRPDNARDIGADELEKLVSKRTVPTPILLPLLLEGE